MDILSDRMYRLGAYLLIVVLGITGFWQIERANDKTDQASKEAAYNLCVGINENRAIIRNLIALGRPLQPPEDSDQWFKDYLAGSNGRNAEFRDEVNRLLADEACPPSPFSDAKR